MSSIATPKIGPALFGQDSCARVIEATRYRAERFSAEEVAESLAVLPARLLQGAEGVAELYAKAKVLAKMLPRANGAASRKGSKLGSLVNEWAAGKLPTRGEMARALVVLRWMLSRCPKHRYHLDRETVKAMKRAAYEAATGTPAPLPATGKKRRG